MWRFLSFDQNGNSKCLVNFSNSGIKYGHEELLLELLQNKLNETTPSIVLSWEQLDVLMPS